MIPAGMGKIAAITGAASGIRQAACRRLPALPLPRRAAKADDPSRVVVLSSSAAPRPKIVSGAYAASKAGVGQLCRVMAAESAASGVLVSALAPGSP